MPLTNNITDLSQKVFCAGACAHFRSINKSNPHNYTDYPQCMELFNPLTVALSKTNFLNFSENDLYFLFGIFWSLEFWFFFRLLFFSPETFLDFFMTLIKIRLSHCQTESSQLRCIPFLGHSHFPKEITICSASHIWNEPQLKGW